MSKMKIVIHPEYSHLREFIEKLPETFSTQGEILYKVRNEVRLIEAEGIKLVVKKFKVPHLINQIVYSFIRKSKARRSYEYSDLLIKTGFQAAFPIAYTEYVENGLFTHSYYISLYCNYKRDFNEFRGRNIDGREKILREFAQFTAQLHEAGIRHFDYGGGNILFEENNDTIRFCLVDVNRLRKGYVSLNDGCDNLRLLYMLQESYEYMITEYARFRNFDPEECKLRIQPYIQKK